MFQIDPSRSETAASLFLSFAPVGQPCCRRTMGHENIWYSHPRKYGPGSRYCRVCANHHGLIRKYGLNICRRCFRQYAADIGFKKLD
ncbi:unnamed protein product [Ixodes pacificus]